MIQNTTNMMVITTNMKMVSFQRTLKLAIFQENNQKTMSKATYRNIMEELTKHPKKKTSTISCKHDLDTTYLKKCHLYR